MDGTNLNRKFRDELLNKYPEVEVTILVSDLAKQVVERQNRERQWPVPEDVFERFWQQAEAFEPQRYIDLRTSPTKVLTFESMFLECLKRRKEDHGS